MGILTKKWPQLSFWLLSLFWLFTLLNPVFKNYDYASEWPSVLGFAVLIFILLCGSFRDPRERNRGEEICWLIFISCVAVSFFFSQTKNTGLSEVLAYISAGNLYFLFASRKEIKHEKILKIIGVGAFLAVFAGYIFYFTSPTPRMFGPFYNILYHSNLWPNAFALFLLMTWPVLFHVLRKNPLIRVLILGITFAALALTYSRGAWMVFAGQLLLFGIYYWKQFSFKNLFRMLGMTVLCSCLFLAANSVRSINYPVLDLQEKVAFQNDEGLTSKSERVEFWRGALDLIREKPLFGFGPHSFRWAYQPIQTIFLGISDHPHNVFLKIALENGLIALAALLGFVIFLIKKIVQSFSAVPKNKRNLAWILIVATTGGVAHNLIDYNFNFLANLILFFLLLALLRSLFVGKEEKKTISKPFLVIAVIIALLAVAEAGLFLAAQRFDRNLLTHSLAPRDYYFDLATEALDAQDYDKTVELANRQIALNPLDDRAYYLRGLANCALKNELPCQQDLRQALELNPLNDFRYYRDYLLQNEDPQTIVRATELLERYFGYVRSNIHFTAYTSNVEAAADLIDVLLPHWPREQRREFLEKKELMIEQAADFRREKKS